MTAIGAGMYRMNETVTATETAIVTGTGTDVIIVIANAIVTVTETAAVIATTTATVPATATTIVITTGIGGIVGTITVIGIMRVTGITPPIAAMSGSVSTLVRRVIAGTAGLQAGIVFISRPMAIMDITNPEPNADA